MVVSLSLILIFISIHAPAKGATFHLCEYQPWHKIFQSTLPRRERPLLLLSFLTFYHFNPRSREGSDLFRPYRQTHICKFQSTLPRRERQQQQAHTDTVTDFNPRSREGSDTSSPNPMCVASTFQSTLPRRERLYCNIKLCDHVKISIHAPAKGATDSLRLTLLLCSYFNPRSREGSDSSLPYCNQITVLFQSTLPRRERLLGILYSTLFP